MTVDILSSAKVDTAQCFAIPRARYDVAQYKLIYVYAINDEVHRGKLKIGETSFSSRDSISQLPPNCPTLNQHAHQRIIKQTRTALVQYELLYTELATRPITMRDGTVQMQTFSDTDVHEVLFASNYSSVRFNESGRPSEWFEVDLQTAKSAIFAVKQGRATIRSKIDTSVIAPPQKAIKLREEQERNVEYTIKMFDKYDTMLWDCKMRYGKTVTAYELIKRKGFKKVIVITHRPAVEDSWDSDHKIMFAGTDHTFLDKTVSTFSYDDKLDAMNDCKLRQMDNSGRPFIYFASIQDLRGSMRVGGKYNKNNAVFDMEWDLLIIDEAHEGTTTDLGDAVISALRKEGTKVLSLSGTPYNIMDDYEENRFTWTYVDEQKAKEKWEVEHPGEKNPYEDLPKMNMFTFDLSEKLDASYRYVTEDSAFNFREFFRTWTGNIERDFYKIPEGKYIGDFVHEDDVYSFLTLISKEDEDSNYPFSCDEYREMFAHTFWMLPGVKEARALSALIKRHPNFSGFEVVNIAGDGDEEKPYDEALALVRSSIKSYPKTITLSCGRLTTGVTVREWTGIMMLSGSYSTAASAYMQSIFRVQSPACINGRQKKNCYVFDFAPDRTLKVIADVHNITNRGIQGDEASRRTLGEFINFCPIIAVEGTVMRAYDVPELMRQIKRISVDAAINSGFDDDTIYIADAGMNLTKFDEDILRKLSDVVIPQKKGNRQKDIPTATAGMTNEQRKKAESAKKKRKQDLTPEEKEALELLKRQKEEQKKMFNLLRAVSIRLPLLFYGADADITQIIRLRDFIDIVDDESWEEFMPSGLRKNLFLDILKYYDEDVVIGAGLRIRKMAKAADELPPTLRAKRIVEIMSKFKNPDKETVLTPWRVVNMHISETLGGYCFYNEAFTNEIEEPRFVEQCNITSKVFLNSDSRILEINSKSGLYPLYIAYSIYNFLLSGTETSHSFDELQMLWRSVLDNNIFVLCKTKMARSITIRTLAGYTDMKVNAIYLTKLLDRMQDVDRLANKLKNPLTWGKIGERMKFDAVVGNPPYQRVIENTSDEQIYPYFMETAYRVSTYVTLITPARFLYNAGKTSKKWNQQMLNDPYLRINRFFNESRHVFPNTSINGGIVITTRDTNCPGEPIKFFGIDDNVAKIQSKVHAHKCFATIQSIVYLQTKFNLDVLFEKYPEVENIVGTEKRLVSSIFEKIPMIFMDKKLDMNYVKILGIQNRKRVYKYIHKELLDSFGNMDKFKVILSAADGASGTLAQSSPARIIGTPELSNQNEGYTQTFISIGAFDTETEMKNLYKYLKCKFTRFMVGTIKATNGLKYDTWANVPIQDFGDSSDIDWNKTVSEIDTQLYVKYDLTQEEIEFIENNVKEMD